MPSGNGALQTMYALAIIWVVSGSAATAQMPVKHFDKYGFDASHYKSFETNKDIPDPIRAQALIALSYYPELKEVPIVFRFRKRKTPLASRPRLFSTLKKKGNRSYVITISCMSRARLSPILFVNLPYNAQIGVLGHELGHISAYHNMELLELPGLIFKLASSEYVDRFEFNTDLISIRHGLGFQLYEWSSYVRSALNISEWKGVAVDYNTGEESLNDQRYMNPQTIAKYMQSMVLYQELMKIQPRENRR